MNIRRVLDWLREGYPTGVPAKDYIPLLALLRTHLTDEEVREVAREIAAEQPDADATDIGVHLTKITDALPSFEEIEAVERRLTQHHGWPVD